MKHEPSIKLLAEAAPRLTKQQISRIEFIVERYEHNENFSGVVEVAIESINTDYPSFVAVVVVFYRTDCDRYSPRYVLTAGGGHFLIGRRGAVTMMSDRALPAHDPKYRISLKDRARALSLRFHAASERRRTPKASAESTSVATPTT